MKATGFALLVAMAAIGGFVAGMMWLSNSTPQLNAVNAYCRGSVEGFYMTKERAPAVAQMELGEKNCRDSIADSYDFSERGFRGPLLP